MSVATIIIEPIERETKMEETIINPPAQHIIDRAIAEGNLEIVQKEADYLKQRLESLRNDVTSRNNTIYSMKETIKEFLIEQTENNNVSAEDAQELADKLDISITKTIAITGSITFSGHVEVSIFEDINDYDVRMNTSVDYLNLSYNGDEVTSLDYDVEDLETHESGY